MGAHRGLHDVHDDVAEVDEHPFAALLAFHAVDVAARRLGLLAHAARERAQLPARLGAGDDDPVEERRQVRDVVDADVLRLDVLEGVDDRPLELADGDQARFSV